MDNITQGTVIYGIRSEKYPEVACYAVVISARCDIANQKINKLYYLSAVNVRDWFFTENGFNTAYHDEISTIKSRFRDKAKRFELNVEVLLGLQYNQAISVLRSSIEDKKKRKQLMEDYEDIRSYINSGNSNERRKLVKRNLAPVSRFLQAVSKGSIFHYFFIPQSAYLDNDIKSKGIMVDLQEIGILTLEDAVRIQSPGIDYRILPEEEDERGRLIRTYWLQDDGDFVAIEGTIKSPWCELLLQRFSNDFLRIGVDNPTKADYEELANQITKG